MNKNLLIVLAYNEENNIQETIVELIDQFDEILIVNDLSTDNTKKIISDLTKVYKNIKVLENPKNYGAGKSFQQAIEYIKNTKNDFENIVKIDGDGQFEKKDIFLVKKLLEKEKSQFIKSNRFWKSGIVGDIPTVRYLGNSIASFAIKFNTGLFLINDPLNGLFGFKKDCISLIILFFIADKIILHNYLLKPIKLKDLISQIKRKFKSKSIVKILEPNNSFMISTKKSEKYEIPLITTSKCIEKNIKFILKFDC
mgnify:CR=1 FL=1